MSESVIGQMHASDSVSGKVQRLMAVRRQCYYYYFLPWYFIPRVLKLASVELYGRNGYDVDSETVNILFFAFYYYFIFYYPQV